MSRRARRERPATAAEQRQVREFADLAAAALSGPVEQRADAVRRMTRVADRLRDPDNLANVPTRDLLDAIAERWPDRETPSLVLTHKNGPYGAPQSGHQGTDFQPQRAGEHHPRAHPAPGTTRGDTTHADHP